MLGTSYAECYDAIFWSFWLPKNVSFLKNSPCFNFNQHLIEVKCTMPILVSHSGEWYCWRNQRGDDSYGGKRHNSILNLAAFVITSLKCAGFRTSLTIYSNNWEKDIEKWIVIKFDVVGTVLAICFLNFWVIGYGKFLSCN